MKNMRKYRLWSILLFWIGFLLVFVLISLPIILNGVGFQCADLTILLFIPLAISWIGSCYYDDLYRKQFIEMIKDDVQKYINEHHRNVDEMSDNEIISIYNKYIKNNHVSNL